jgi:hypothetical protein
MASLSSQNWSAYRNSVSEAIGAVPTGATDLTTTDTRVYQIHFVNTTAGALTVTLKDKQSTPRNLLTAYSIPANSYAKLDWPEGLFFSGGLNWIASGSGVEASVTAWYK